MTQAEYDKKRYAALKADPVKYATYLERKRREAKRRPGYEARRKKAWREGNPGQNEVLRAAHHAVERAVRSGKLYKRNSCANCGLIGKVEAHHHKGYAPENWLDVVWLCPPCHRKADVNCSK